MPSDRDEPTRQKEHDENDERAEHKVVVFVQETQRLGQRVDDECPEERPGDGPHAANDHHDQDPDRKVDREAVRRDEAHVMGIKRAGEAGDAGRQDKNDNLGALDVDAHARGRRLVLSDRFQRPAESRIDKPPVKEDEHPEASQHKPVIVAVIAQCEVEKVWPRNARHALHAAGQPFQVHGEQVHDQSECNGNHRQEVSGQFECWKTEQHAEGRGKQDSGGNRKPWRNTELYREERRSVGANQEESRLTERDEPGIAGDQIEAQGQDREDPDQHHDLKWIRPKPPRQRHEDDGDSGEKRKVDYAARCHDRVPARSAMVRKEAFRPEQQHRDEDAKGDEIAILGRDVESRQIVENADEEAAQERARITAEAADDCGDE